MAVHLRGRARETMKIKRNNFVNARERGVVATVLFIALLAIMLILVTAESRALFHLHRDVKFLEQQQLKRVTSAPTHSV